MMSTETRQVAHRIANDELLLSESRSKLANVIDEALRNEREWRPMGTAPRDGREVLLYVERRAGIAGGMLVGHYMLGGHCIEDHPAIDQGWYFWNGSMFDKASKPTHWMPLPAPPIRY